MCRYGTLIALLSAAALLTGCGAAAAKPSHDLTGTWTNSAGPGTTLEITQHGADLTWVGGPNDKAWVQYFNGKVAGSAFSGTFRQDAPTIVPQRFHGEMQASIDDGCHFTFTKIVQAGTRTLSNRWVLLYNCSNKNAANPRGIWMRLAKQPWGPWTQPQTIFATSSGLCMFIHRAVTPTQQQCDNMSTPERLPVQGGDYSPDIIAPFTTGTHAAAHTRGSSTFYYTMSTWNPYQVVIMSATIEGPPSR